LALDKFEAEINDLMRLHRLTRRTRQNVEQKLSCALTDADAVNVHGRQRGDDLRADLEIAEAGIRRAACARWWRSETIGPGLEPRQMHRCGFSSPPCLG
jgi:hypothetical protein